VHRVALIALVICYGIEVAQLTPVPAYLSEQHVLLRLAFGTTFSAWDLVAYTVGGALGAGLQWLFLRRWPVRS
jgi:hypothetical protein